MARRSLLSSDLVTEYVQRRIPQETPVQQRLRAETAKLPQGGMQIGPDQGALMSLLIKLIGATKAIEIGTFTGYSALCVASALPPDGRLICCDVSEEWTGIAQRFWREAGVEHKIDLRLAPAAETVESLLKAGGAETFDFAFIDADKSGYDTYYEGCLRLLRPGGLIAIDNALYGGRVPDERVTDADTSAIRALNAKIASDARVDASLLSVGDGVMLARKR
jgi:predicted O-methyltransferase YrrM